VEFSFAPTCKRLSCCTYSRHLNTAFLLASFNHPCSPADAIIFTAGFGQPSGPRGFPQSLSSFLFPLPLLDAVECTFQFEMSPLLRPSKQVRHRGMSRFRLQAAPGCFLLFSFLLLCGMEWRALPTCNVTLASTVGAGPTPRN
jgi:hypothetical protein